jgi:hypothetical protein
MKRNLVIGLIVALAALVPAGSAGAGIGKFGCPVGGKLVVKKGITHDVEFEKWADSVRATSRGSAVLWRHLDSANDAMARADYCGDGRAH